MAKKAAKRSAGVGRPLDIPGEPRDHKFPQARVTAREHHALHDWAEANGMNASAALRVAVERLTRSVESDDSLRGALERLLAEPSRKTAKRMSKKKSPRKR